ncbi:MAG: ribokinase, partial [Acidimicrobiales bacterium]
MSRACSVLVVGSINEDVVLRLSRPVLSGETVTAVGVDRFPGGKGANQAVAAARAGAAVAMLARVGDDPAGKRMLDDLGRENVDTAAVRGLPGVATGAAYITVTPDGDSTIIVDPGANARLRPEDVEAEGDALSAAAVMVAQLEVPLDTVAAAVRLAVATGTRAVVSLAPATAVPGVVLSGLDPLLVNEHEAAFFLGEQSVADHAEEAARRLLEGGPRSVVITLGPRGAVIADSSGTRRLPAAPAKTVVDTTGAGDAFA